MEIGVNCIIAPNNYKVMHEEQTILLTSWLLNIPLFMYGINDETEKAIISLHLESKKQQIIFSIDNTKPKNDFGKTSDKSKIGLVNVRKQLDLLYPKKHQLEIEETQITYAVKLYLNI